MTENDEQSNYPKKPPAENVCYSYQPDDVCFEFSTDGRVVLTGSSLDDEATKHGICVTAATGRELLVSGAVSVALTAVVRAADYLFDMVADEQ